MPCFEPTFDFWKDSLLVFAVIFRMWISQVFPRLDSPSKEKGDSATRFKQDLMEYLSAYKAYQLRDWIEHISKHDMSSAK